MKKNRNGRRAKALVRLEAQLEAGVKTNQGKETKLVEKDIKRINKEITILNNKLKGEEK